VIQECINNVIKHSGATLLDISIIKDEEGISVTIEDNGRGFDVSDKSKFEGIGLKNIQTRVNYLKGTVEWESTINKGTLVIIHVP
jgi:two-component system, NarL family, sensor kinase